MYVSIHHELALLQTVSSLEKDIAGLKKEIGERDETIGDKEKRIYDLKKKNQAKLILHSLLGSAPFYSVLEHPDTTISLCL